MKEENDCLRLWHFYICDKYIFADDTEQTFMIRI
jgi:hypothetical protein